MQCFGNRLGCVNPDRACNNSAQRDNVYPRMMKGTNNGEMMGIVHHQRD